ncbi:hypothetical protein TrCOL_g3651 [Triparma columacea]|uniref:Uncharacterized protein n=1 Tax=Triparma columacea TaxID=722753 RepID=A0A9W7GL93_9STRA|nr:hypothetical protein TrCOL_g3651 [Triparma columacea]
MGGSQGALAKKLAEAKRKNALEGGGEEVTMAEEPMSSEEEKMKRDFAYMINNDAYSLRNDEEDSMEIASSSSTSRAPPPPKLYVGDDFPLSEQQLREYCLAPSGEMSTACGNSKYKVLVIDPRPNSVFLREAFSSVVPNVAALPKEASYVFISPTSAGQVRKMIKSAMKKSKAGNVDGLLKDGYEDLKGRVQVYSSGEDGGALYRTLGIAGDGQIFSLWVIGYEVKTRKVKIISPKQDSLVSISSLSEAVNKCMVK